MQFQMRIAALAAVTAMLAGAAHAGSSRAGAASLPPAQVQSFAQKVEQTLADRGAHVALVARVGRERKDLPSGIQFTHAAFWVYSSFKAKDGSVHRGYQVFNLYQRESDPGASDLVRDRPYDFFAGGVMLEGGIAIPDPRLQKKLLTVLTGPTHAELHNPSYSLLSNPDNNLYQNCTEHSLNVLFAALYETDEMPRIKANIAAHYAAQPITLSPLKRALGPVFVAGVETDDHTKGIQTTTFTSIARFMEKHDLASEVLRITPSGVHPLHGAPPAI